MARDSRPPGFDMSYRPEEPVRFGPSLRARLPSYAYLAVAVLFAAFIGYGHFAPVGSFAYRWVIEAAPHRPFASSTFAWIALTAGAASVLRTHLRGVVVRPDGIETLDLAALGFPKIRRFDWPMIDSFRFDVSDTLIGIDLWNGTREYFPEVGDRDALVRALVYVAEARAIPYRGGPLTDAAPAAYR